MNCQILSIKRFLRYPYWWFLLLLSFFRTVILSLTSFIDWGTRLVPLSTPPLLSETAVLSSHNISYCVIEGAKLCSSRSPILSMLPTTILSLIFIEEGVKVGAGVHTMRVSHKLWFYALERCQYLFLFWAFGLGSGASSHLDLPCLLHEFVQNFIFQNSVIKKLEVLKVLNWILLPSGIDLSR